MYHQVTYLEWIWSLHIIHLR